MMEKRAAQKKAELEAARERQKQLNALKAGAGSRTTHGLSAEEEKARAEAAAASQAAKDAEATALKVGGMVGGWCGRWVRG